MKKFGLLFVLACVIAAAPVSWAQTVTATQALAFGSFAAAAVAGTVTVTAGGTRSSGGGVILVPSGGGGAASFSVTGSPGATYAITLPSNGSVLLSSGSNTMGVNNFTSSPTSNGQLSGGGSQTLMVGATLSVGASQARGSYSGTFDVTVNYN